MPADASSASPTATTCQADFILAWQKIRAQGNLPNYQPHRPNQLKGPAPGPPGENQGHTQPPAGCLPRPEPETPPNTKID